MKNLLKLIQDSALKLVMLDERDLQGLAEIHTQFEKISTLAAQQTPDDDGNSWQQVQDASKASASLIEKIILAELDDTAGTLKAIGDTAKTLQTLVEKACEGQKIPSLVFPPELGLPNTDATPTKQATQTSNTEPHRSNQVQITLPENVDEDIFREFLTSQPHVQQNLEAAILAAEKEPSEENRIAIKAILHNMKGEAGLMGLQEMAAACHEAESLLENNPDNFPAEKLLATKDWLQNAIQSISSGKLVFSNTNENDLIDHTNQNETPNAPIPSEPKPPAAQQEESDLMVIPEGDVPLVMDFINESNEHLESAEAGLLTIEENPHDSETLNSIFRAFHTIKGVAGFLNLSHIGSLAHVAENLLDLGRKGNLVLTGTNIDVVFEAIDATKSMLGSLLESVENHQPVQPYANLDDLITRIKACVTGEAPPPRLGEMLIENGTTSRGEIREALKEQKSNPQENKKLGEILVERKAVTSEQLEEAINKQNSAKADYNNAPASPTERRKPTTTAESTVKVTTGRLDSLINMVGELVIAQSMVSQDLSMLAGNQRLARNQRHLDKITRDLQELSMSMRMVPVQGVFQKMARLVRDLSRKAGKEIDLVMTGAETELDRNVVEAIADPLVHMIRNSVDHGVENPADRQAAGKSPTGRVELRAFHQAGNICIEIADDGRGLNRDRILKKALTTGVVKEGQELTDQEIFKLIFHAGLSTAEKVTDISGRGVGMDVVRKNIEALRGRIEINSVEGKGTTFSIMLPLTLAVIDGQLVTVGSHRFIIPTISIEQSLKPNKKQISTVQGARGEMMMIRDQLLPLVRLYDLFGIKPENTDPCQSLVVVVADGASRCCLQVDSLLGQQQVVIKSLGEFLGAIKGIAGGAIMGDGNVSLILDVPNMIKLASEK